MAPVPFTTSTKIEIGWIASHNQFTLDQDRLDMFTEHCFIIADSAQFINRCKLKDSLSCNFQYSFSFISTGNSPLLLKQFLMHSIFAGLWLAVSMIPPSASRNFRHFYSWRCAVVEIDGYHSKSPGCCNKVLHHQSLIRPSRPTTTCSLMSLSFVALPTRNHTAVVNFTGIQLVRLSIFFPIVPQFLICFDQWHVKPILGCKYGRV